MSTTNSDLLLHLVLDDIQDGQVRDSSTYGKHGTAQGEPSPVPDENFSSCISFDGVDDFVQLPAIDIDPSLGLTIEAWVFYSSFKDSSTIVELGNGKNSDNISLSNEGATSNLAFEIYRGSTARQLIAEGVLKAGVWMHLAAAVDKDGNATLYVNEKQVAGAAIQAPNNVTRENNYVGRGNLDGRNFQGKLAHVRLHNRALSGEEVAGDMEAGLGALLPFNRTRPIEFHLYDDDDQQVLYIDNNPSGRNLRVEIGNVSQRSIMLDAPDGTSASEENHHFELRFRPGVLSSKSINKLSLAEKDWALGRKQMVDGSFAIYLLNKNGLAVEPGQTINLRLEHVSADGRGGSRGTRVVLHYKQVGYADDSTPLTGHHVHHLSIVNQRGKQTLPVHVGFVGPNAILNDGKTTSDLTLRFVNVLEDDSLALYTSKDGAPSTFIITFDAQGERQEEWALGTLSQVQAIKIHWGLVGTLSKSVNGTKGSPDKLVLSMISPLAQDLPAGTGLEVISPESAHTGVVVAEAAPAGQLSITLQQQSVEFAEGSEIYLNDGGFWEREEEQGERPEWIFKNQSVTELKAGDGIQFRITGIVSSLPSGSANLYFRYENIPGYWDGQFIPTIQKSPVVYQEREPGVALIASGNLGVGKPDANSTFAIHDTRRLASRITITGQEYYQDNNTSDNGVALLLGVNRSVNRQLWIADSDPDSNKPVVRFALGGTVPVIDAISKDGNTAQVLSIGPEADVVFGAGDGKVGIGTDDPSEKLEVAGNIVAQNVSLTDSDNKAGALFLSGIGDFNQALYSNESSADGDGGWKGGRLNNSRGLQIRVGKDDAKQTALCITESGNVGIGTSQPQGRLDVNGTIKSPMWRAYPVSQLQQGPLPVSLPFSSNGGTLLIFASGSGRRKEVGEVGMDIWVDSSYLASVITWTNEKNSHKFFSNVAIAAGVAAGKHNVILKIFSDAPEMITDTNDFFNVTILELPF